MQEAVSFEPIDEIDALVQQAQAGAEDALTRLCDLVTPRLFVGISLRLARTTSGAIEAEEILQETWVRALPRLAQFTRKGSFVGWLFAFSKNILLEISRRGRAERGLSIGPPATGEIGVSPSALPASVTSISQRIARRESIRRLVDDLSTFDRTDHEILILLGIEELSVHDVADRLNLPQPAVAKRWYRLREKLAAMHRE